MNGASSVRPGGTDPVDMATDRDADAPAGTVPGRGAAARLIAIGAVLGLAWTTSLRAYMTALAGDESTFTWAGTFVVLTVPGVVVGGLLGWAEHLRRTGRRGRRWLVLAPLLLPAATLSIPGAFMHMLRTGEGTSAIGFTLLGMLGGVALSGRGGRVVRTLCGTAGFALVPTAFLAPPIRPALDPCTPYGAWVAMLLSVLLLVLAMACAVPMRRGAPPHGTHTPDEA
jgi:hypothetical protein